MSKHKAELSKKKKFANFLKKPAAILAVAGLVLTGLVALQVVNPPKAEAAWEHWGDPATINGHVYVDNGGYVSGFETGKGDKPIKDVLLNAYLVKEDGTVITLRDENRKPTPLTVKTLDDGSFSFNFLPLLEAAYGPNASSRQLKLALHDRVRVWPDESNYQPGGALEGKTPKRINGGTRLMEISTMTLSYLGTTNYVQGSISKFNMAFREDTSNEVGAIDDNGFGKHLPEDQWQPTAKHDIPQSDPSGNNTYQDYQPYVCGVVYADMVWPFQFFNSGQDGLHPNANASPDKVVPGIRVAVTTYETDSAGNPTTQLQTRYDYTDFNGRWCVKWDHIRGDVKTTTNRAKTLATIAVPQRGDEQALQAFQAHKHKYPEFYSGINKPVVAGENGLPEGFSSLALDGWQGKVKTLHDLNSGAACKLSSDCFSNMQSRERNFDAFAADGIDLGIITKEVTADYDRYSHEQGTSQNINVTLHGTSVIDPLHKVVMVPLGTDPTDESNWFAQSAIFDGASATIPVDDRIPVGDYALYVYSVNKFNQIQFDQLRDVDNYRITDTIGHYYTSQQQQQHAWQTLINEGNPADSVASVRPGETLWGVYEDIGEGSHKVELVENTSDKVVAPLLTGDNGVKSYIENEGADDQKWQPYLGKDQSFDIPGDIAPGNYRIRVTNGYGEYVNYTPITVMAPAMTLTPAMLKPGESTTVDVENLQPNTQYYVTFHPEKVTKPPIAAEILADENGHGSATITVVDDIEYLGTGEVRLTRTPHSETVLATQPLRVNRISGGPSIVLPNVFEGTGDHSGFVGPDHDKFPCNDNLHCEVRWHIEQGTPVYHVAPVKNVNFRVFAVDTETNTQIPGNGTVNGRYRWDIAVEAYKQNGAEWSSDPYSVEWRGTDSSYLRLDKPVSGAWYYVVSVSVHDTHTNLSDTRKFIAYPEFFAGGAGKTEIGSPGQDTFEPFAAVLEVNEPIPAQKFCYESSESNSKTGYAHLKNNSANWIDGISFEDVTINGQHYACMTGTPTKTTDKGQFEYFWPVPDFQRKSIFGPSPKDVNVLPFSLAVHDTKSPVVSAEWDGREVENGGTITVTQGDTHIPLTLLAHDNYSLGGSDTVQTAVTVAKNGLPTAGGTQDTISPSEPKSECSIDGIDPVSGSVDSCPYIIRDFSDMKVGEKTPVGIYPMTFHVEDTFGNVTEDFTINIKVEKNIVPPVFGSGTPPEGQVTVPYQWRIPVSDGDASSGGFIKKIDIVDGNLPPGLDIVPKNKGEFFLVANIPTKAGLYDFTLEATDNDNATQEKTYQIRILPAPTPEWDAETENFHDDLVIEVGKENTLGEDGVPLPWMTLGLKDQGVGTAQWSSYQTHQAPGTQTITMPDGLEFSDGKIYGIAEQVDEVGTDYTFVASNGDDDPSQITKTITIKVVDTTPPNVEDFSKVSFKVNEKAKIPISATDNSGEQPQLYDPVCTSQTDPDKTLAMSVNGQTIVSDTVLSSNDKGSYDCSIKVADGHHIGDGRPHGNETTPRFVLKVRQPGPELNITPEEQTVILSEKDTPITPIVVDYVEPGATLNIDKTTCQDSFPASVQWNAEKYQFEGTVSSTTNKTYTCDVSATDQANVTSTVTLTIRVRGPLADGPTDDSGKYVLNGVVGRPLAQPEPFVANPNVTLELDEQSLTTQLSDYFASGQPTFSDGMFQGTPTAPTPETKKVIINAKGMKGGEQYSVPITVYVNIEPEPYIDNIPASGTPGQKFYPKVTNPLAGEQYNIFICPDPQCTQAYQTGHPGTAMHIPDTQGDVFYVKASTTDSVAVRTNTDRITVTPVDLIHASTGAAITSSGQGGEKMDFKLVNPDPDETYDVKVCHQTDQTQCDTIASGVNSESFDYTLPLVNAPGGDPTNGYVAIVTRHSDGEEVITKEFKVVAGSVDTSSATVRGPSTSSVANGVDKQIVTITLVDANGNPVTGEAKNIDATWQGAKYLDANVKAGDSAGTYLIELTSTKVVDNFPIQVTYRGDALKEPVNVNFHVGTLSIDHSTAKVVDNNAFSNGDARNRIRVTLVDEFDNPITDYDFDTTEGSDDLPLYDRPTGENVMQFAIPRIDQVINNGDGTYDFYFTSNRPGLLTHIQMRVGGKVINPVDVEVSGAQGDISCIYDPDAVARGKSQLCSKFVFGNISKEKSFITVAPAKQDSDPHTGVDRPVIPQTMVDDYFAEIDPEGTMPDVQRYHMLLEDDRFADYIYTVTVSIRDDAGHGLAGMAGHGYRIVFPTVAGTPEDGYTYATPDGIILDNTFMGVKEDPARPGDYVFMFASTKAGEVKAKVHCSPVDLPLVTGTFTAMEPKKAQFKDVPTDTQISGQPLANPGQAIIKDANGNNVAPGTAVFITVPGNTTPQRVVVGEDGVAPIPAISAFGRVSDNTITVYAATADGTAADMDTILGSTQLTIENGDPAAEKSELQLSPQKPYADEDTVTISGTVRDAAGNPVINRILSLTIPANPHKVINVRTNDHGELVSYGQPLQFLAGKPGVEQTVTLHSQSTGEGTTVATATVTPIKRADKDGVPAVDGTNLSTVQVTAGPVTASGSDQDTYRVTVQLRDAYGDPINDPAKAGNLKVTSLTDGYDFGDTIKIVGSGGFTLLDDDQSQGQGLYYVDITSKKVGTAEVKVTYEVGDKVIEPQVLRNNQVSDRPLSMRFVPGPFSADKSQLKVVRIVGDGTEELPTDSHGHSVAIAGDNLRTIFVPRDEYGHILDLDGPVITIRVEGLHDEVVLEENEDGTWSHYGKAKIATDEGIEMPTTVKHAGETFPGPSTILAVKPGKPATTLADDALAGKEPSQATVPTGSIPANNQDVYVTIDRLADAYGNLVIPETLSADFDVPQQLGVTITKDNGDPVDGTIIVHDGKLRVKVPTDAEGRYSFQFSWADNPLGNPQVVVVSAQTEGVLNVADSAFTVTPGGVLVADGQQQQTVTVTLVDLQDDPQPITGKQNDISVAVHGTSGTDMPGVSITNVTETQTPGVYTATLTSTKAGRGDVVVTYAGQGISIADTSDSQIQFKPGQPTHVDFSVITQPLTSGVRQGDVKALVTDAQGNPIDRYTKLWVAMPASEEPVEVTADHSGKITLPAFTPGSVSDNKIIVYMPTTDGQAADTSQVVDQTTVTIKAGPPAAASKLTLTPAQEYEDSGQPIEYSQVNMSARVVDQAGNPVAEDTTIVIATPDGDIEASTTLGGGIMSLVPLSFTAGQQGVQQRVDMYYVSADGTRVPLDTQFVTPKKDPDVIGEVVFEGEHASKAAISTGDKLANHEDAHTVTVTLRNRYGDPVSGRANKLSLTNLDGDNPNVTLGTFSETDKPGVYTATVTSAEVREVDVRATYDSRSITPLTLAANFVAGPFDKDNSLLRVTDTDGTPIDRVKAGNKIRITVTPKDASGHIVLPTGLTESSTMKVNVPGIAGTQELIRQEDGTYSAVLTPVKPTAAESKVTFPEGSPMQGRYAPLVVTYGDITSAKLADQSGIIRAQNDKDITITVRDKANNLAPKGTVIYVSHPDAASVIPVTVGDNGVATLTADKARFTYKEETDYLTVYADEGKQFEIGRAKVTGHVGQADPEHSIMNVVPTQPVEYTQVRLDVVVRDKMNNIRKDFDVYVYVPNADSEHRIVKARTDSNGNLLDLGGSKIFGTAGIHGERDAFYMFQRHNYESYLENNPDQARVPTNRADAVVYFTPIKDPVEQAKPVVKSDGSRSTVTISEGAKVADKQQSHTVTVTLKNKYGDPVSGQADKLSLENTADGFVTAGADANLFFGDPVFTETQTPGVYQAHVTSTLAKTARLTARWDASLVLNSTPKDAPFINGAPAQATLEYVPGVTIENKPVTVNGVVHDKYGNPVVNALSDLSLAIDVDGNVDNVMVRTDAQGRILDRQTSKAVTFTMGNLSTTATTSLYPNDDQSGKAIATISATAQENPGETQIPVFTGEQYSKVEVIPTESQVVGSYFRLRVTLLNKYKNPVTGQKDNLSIADESPASNGFNSTNLKLSTFTETQDGVYEATVWSSNAGIAAGAVKYQGEFVPTYQVGSPKMRAAFVPDVPDAGTSTLALDHLGHGDNPVEGQIVTVRAKLFDKYSNIIPARNIKVVLPNGDIVDAKTSANGDVIVRNATGADNKIKFSTAGLQGQKLTVAIYGEDSTDGKPLKTASVTPIKDPVKQGIPVRENSSATIDEGPKVANGKDAYTVTVTLKDIYGDPVSGDAVKLATSDREDLFSYGENLFVELFREDQSHPGTYTTKVTATLAATAQGVVTYKSPAPVGMWDINTEPLSATFVKDSLDLTEDGHSYFDVTRGQVVANGTSTHTIMVRLTDAKDNGYTGRTVTATTDHPNTTISDFTEVEADHPREQGFYKATVTSTTAGQAHIAVNVAGEDGGAVTVKSDGNGIARFKADIVNLDREHSNYRVPDEGVLVGKPQTITVKLADLNDNPITGRADDLQATHVRDDERNTIDEVTFDSAGFVETDTKGTYTTTVTTTQAGQAVLSVTLFGPNGGEVLSAEEGKDKAIFNVGDVDFTTNEYSRYSVSDGNKVANGTDQHMVTVHLADKYGNPISGATLTLKHEGVPVTFGDVTDSHNGTYTVPVTSTTAGTAHITVAVNGKTLNSSGGTDAVFVAGPTDTSVDSTYFEVTEGANKAGTAHTVTVVLTDADGNPVTGEQDNLTMTQDGLAHSADTSLSAFKAVSGSPGTYTATINSRRAGVATVTVTHSGNAVSAKEGHNTATFIVNDYYANETTLVITGSDSQQVSTITAGDTVTLTLTPKDFFTNKTSLPGDPDTVSVFVPGVGGTVTLTKTEDGTYTATVTPTIKAKAPLNKVTYPDGSVLAGNKQIGRVAMPTLTVNPAAPASVQWDKSGPIIATNGQEITNPGGFTVKDTYGNIVDGGVALTVAVPGKKPQSQTTDVAGHASIPKFTGIEGDDLKVEVTYGDTVIGTKVVTTQSDVPSGDNTTLTLSAAKPYSNTDSRPIDGTQVTVNAVIKDGVGSGMAVPNTPVWVQITTSNADNEQQVHIIEARTDDNGVVLVEGNKPTFTAGKYDTTNKVDIFTADPQTQSTQSPLTGAEVVSAKDPDKENVALFSSGYSTASITDQAKVAGVDKHTVTVTLKDFYNEPVTGKAAQLTLSALDGSLPWATLGTFTEVEGQPGTYTADIQSRDAGTVRIKAVYDNTKDIMSVEDSSSSTLTGEFKAGEPDKTTSTVSVSPTEPHEGEDVTVTAVVKDTNGNPVPDTDVTVVLPDGTRVAARTDANGNVKPVTGEAITFGTADDNGKELTVKLYNGTQVNETRLLASASVTPTQDQDKVGIPIFSADGTSSVAAVTAGKEKADGFSAHTVSVKLINKYGDPIYGKKAHLKLRLASGQDGYDEGSNIWFSDFTGADNPPAPGNRSSDDIYTATVTTTKAGTPIVEAVYDQSTLIQPVTTLGGATTDNLDPVFVRDQSTLMVTTDDDKALPARGVARDTTVKFTYRPLDANGKVEQLGDAQVTVAVAGADPATVTLTGPDSDGNYTATATMTTVGDNEASVTVTHDDTDVAGPTTTIGVNPKAPQVLVDESATNGSATIKVKPDTGTTPTLTVKGVDRTADLSDQPDSDGYYTLTIPASDRPYTGVLDVAAQSIHDVTNKQSVKAEASVTALVTPVPTGITANLVGIKGQVDDSVPVGSTVYIYGPSDSEPIGEGQVDDDHQISATYYDRVEAPGTVKATVVDKNTGRESAKSSSVTVNATVPDAPRVEFSATKPTQVTATIAADEVASACVITSGSTACTPVPVTQITGPDDDGKVTITGLTLADKDTVRVTATNTVGNSTSTDKVIDLKAPEAPVVQLSEPDDYGRTTIKVIVGEGADNAGTPTLTVDGTTVQLTSAGNRTYTYTTPQAVGEDQQVSATVTDETGNVSQPTQTIIAKVTTQPVENLKAGSTKVVGTVPDSVNESSTVTVYNNGKAIGHANVITSGGQKVFTVTYDEDKKPDDRDELTVIVTDHLTGIDSPRTSVTVDGVAPVVTVEPSKGDKVAFTVDDDSATVTVTYTPEGSDSSVTKKVSDLECETVDGVTTCSLAPVAKHGTDITVKAVDPAGNTTTATTQADSVAPKAPTVTLSEPNVSGQVTITVTPQDGDDNKGTLTLTVAGQKVTATKHDDGTYTYTTPNAVGEDQQVSATLTDEAGNTSDATTATIPAQETVAGTQAVSTMTTMTGTVAGDIPVESTVTVKDADDRVIGTGKVTEKDGKKVFTVTYDVDKQPVDKAVVTVTVTDKNTNIESEPTSVTVDGINPVVTVAPSNGTTVSGSVDEDVSSVTVRYTDTNGDTQSTAAEVTTDEDGTVTFSADLPDDVNTNESFTVVAVDKAGNKGDMESTFDTLAPIVTVDPTNGSAVRGSVNEPVSSVTVTYIDKQGDEQTISATVPVADPTSFSVDLPDDVDTSKPLTIKATDMAGNIGSTSVTPDTVAPVVTVKPSKGDKVSFTVDDDSAAVTVTYTPEGSDSSVTKKVSDLECKTTDGVTTCSLAPAAKHGTDITVKAVDPAGNTTTATTQADSVAPKAPTVTLSEPDKYGRTTVTVTPAQGADNQGTPTLTIDGVEKPLTENDDGTYTYTTDQAVNKAQTVAVTMTDKAGNVSEEQTVSIPAVTTAKVTNATSTVTAMTGSVDDSVAVGSSVTVKDADDRVIGTGKVTEKDGKKVFTVTYDADKQPVDKAVVTVTVKDKHTTIDSAATSVTVDGIAPKVSVNPTNGTTISGSVDEDVSSVTVRYTDTNGDTHTVRATVTPAGDGHVTYATNLPDDVDTSKDIAVTATDMSGNQTSQTVTPDTVAPVVTVKPSKGDKVAFTVDDDSAVVTVTYTPEGSDSSVTKNVSDLECETADGVTTCSLAPAAKHGTDITVKAVDPAGNTTTATTQADSVAPKAPRLNDTEGKKGDAITGKAEIGSTVTITYTDNDGNDKTVEVTVGSDGTFSYTLPTRLKNGSDITVSATDPVGNTSTSTTSTVNRDVPVINSDVSNGTFVAGSVSNGARLSLSYWDRAGVFHEGIDVPTTPNATLGLDEFDMTLTPQADTDKPMTLTATMDNGEKATDTVDTDTTTPKAPGDITVTPGNVSGTGEAGATVTVILPNGDKLTGTVDTKGNFSIDIPDDMMPDEGSTITVVQTDAARNESDSTTTTVDTTNTLGDIDVAEDGATVSGTTDPNSTVTITDDKGNVIGTATADEDGNFTVTIDDEANHLKAGDAVTVTTTDPAGHVETSMEIFTPQPPAAPTLNPLDKTTISGKAPAGTQVNICIHHGDGTTTCTTVTVADDGTFTVPVDTPLQPGERVTATTVNPVNGAQSQADQLVVPGKPAPSGGEVSPKPGTPDNHGIDGTGVADLSKTGTTGGVTAIVALLLSATGIGIVAGRRAARRRIDSM